MKVYLSPSSQTYNIGVGEYGSESLRMTQITEVVKKKLAYKFDVKVARLEQSLAERVSIANNWGADVYVAIHSNAGGGKGCEVFAYSSVSAGDKIAKLIYNRLEKITPSEDRGVKYNPNFYELRATNAPACLIEVAFHDNIEDAKWIINNISLIGEEIAKGIYEYFEIEYEEITGEGQIATIQRTLNERYGYSIAVDNIFGPETKAALVKALQQELNVQFDAKIVEDGIFGTKTKAACVNVKKGAKGNITWLIQAMLVCKGYNIEADGVFGSNTEEAIIDFQNKNGLAADGICGKNTFEKLFG